MSNEASDRQYATGVFYFYLSARLKNLTGRASAPAIICRDFDAYLAGPGSWLLRREPSLLGAGS